MSKKLPAVLPATSGVAEVNNAKLYYEVMGQGQPLVLIHAGIADSRVWDDQFGVFARHYRVIRYDVRGFGRSRTVGSTPPANVTYADHQDLYALLKFLDVDQALILGLSNGGRIATDFALAYPAMAKALILVASALAGYEYIDEATVQKDAACDEALDRGDIAQAVELNLQLWIDGPHRTPNQIDPGVHERAHAMLTYLCEQPEDSGERHPLEPLAISRLAELHLPALLMVGDQDVADMLTIADVLATGIKGSEKAVMTEVAHLPNMEKPAEFNQIVLNFLNRLNGDQYRG